MKSFGNGMLLRAFLGSALTIGAVSGLQAQTDTAKNAYDGLTLKDLLNVKIVSASKKSELLFDAPLSASVVTKEDIRKAGSTSIMEALRLVPGMIVREQTNGNYDIHLRGMDNVPPNSPFDLTANTTTLVMIDNRPIYNYLRGGTFWETLPVDLNDVERIEVVRGPAAALYGPNAVNGVINIITRQYKKTGLHLAANTQRGSFNTFINNATLGYATRKFSFTVSGNHQRRDRTQDSYYEYNRNAFFENPSYMLNFLGDTARNMDQRYPDRSLAMEKYAGNIFASYNPADKISFNLSAGAQHSFTQKVLHETQITPLSSSSSDSRYADLRATVKGFSAQLSYNEGTQLKDYTPGNKYDFNTFDANVEYNFTKENFSLKPGVSYRRAVYDDTRYSDLVNKTGVFNARGVIETEAAYLRGEYKLLGSRLRLVAGLAANKFNYPDKTYLSYQFATTYKLNKKHLLRFVFSKAPRSSNIFDSFVDQVVYHYPVGYRKYAEMTVTGRKDLRLLTSGLIELGYRGQLNTKLSLDVELFSMHAHDYSAFVQQAAHVYLRGQDTILHTSVSAANLPMHFVQRGVTVSANYQAKRFQLKPFVTIQASRLKDYAPFLNTPDANPGAPHIYSGLGTTQRVKSTPAVFGGAAITYAFAPKWDLGVDAYYYSKQTYSHVSSIIFNDGRGIDELKSKLIINATLSYEPLKGLDIFVSGKNLLNDRSREFFYADNAPFMFMGGLRYSL